MICKKSISLQDFYFWYELIVQQNLFGVMSKYWFLAKQSRIAGREMSNDSLRHASKEEAERGHPYK